MYNLGTAEGKIVIDGSGASKGFSAAGTAANAFFRVIESKLNSVKQLGQNMLKVGASTSAGLAVAVNSAASFEERLSAIRAVSGATASEMDQISKAALRIGKDTSFSATEAASAMEELVKAGVSTKEVLSGAADATVSLAAAGEIALPQAAEIASAAMNNFNLEGKDMPKVADLIAGAANASAISVSEFGMSLQQSGAVANLAGLSFDDLAISVAEMGNAGIKGSDAGTSLKTFLSNLIPTTDRQREAFQKLGIITKDGGNQFFDAAGNVKSLSDIQEILKVATKNLTKEQKLSTLETMFGSDAIRAAAVMSENGAAGYDKMAKSMGKVKAVDVAAARLDNLKGSIEQFKGSMETAMITIGSVFLPVVRKVVDAATALVNVFNNLPTGVQKAIAIFLGLVAVISTIGGALITLSLALAPIIAHFVAMFILKQLASIVLAGASAMTTGAGAAGAYSAAMSRASVVIGRFIRIGKIFVATAKLMRAAWLIMTGPIGIAIAVILGLVAAGKILYDRWKPFRDLVDKIASVLKDKFNVALNAVKRAMQLVVDGFNSANKSGKGVAGLFIRVGQAAKSVWNGLVRLGQAFNQYVIPALKQAGGQIVQSFLKAWNDVGSTFRTQVLPAFQQIWGSIQTQLMPAITKLAVAVSPLVGAFLKLAGFLAKVVLVALFKFAMFVIKYVIPAIIKVAAFIISVLAPAIAVIIQVIVQVIAWIAKLAAWLIGGIAVAVGKFVSILKAGIDKIVSFIKTGLTVARAIWDSIWKTFGPLIKAVFDLIISIVKLEIAIIKLVIGRGIAAIKAVWTPAWNFLKKVSSSVLNAIKSATSKAIKAIRGLFKSGVVFVNRIWSSAFNKLNETTGGKLGSVKEKIRSAIRSIKNFFSGAGSWLYAAGRAIIQGLINGISSLVGTLTNKITSITNKIKSVTSKILQIRSPSKVFYKIGAYMMSGWLGGIKANAPKLYTYMKKIASKISDVKVTKSKKNQITDLVSSYTTDLTRLNKTIDKVQAKLKTASDKYKELVAEAKQYRAELKASAAGGITSIDVREGSAGADFATSLEQRLKKAKEFLANVKKLKKAGLNKQYLKEIVDAGAEGGGETAAALAGDIGSIDSINKLKKELSAVGDKIGAFGVSSFKKAGIDMAAGLVAGLKKKESALVKGITVLAKKMIAALKKQLKMKSPSRVMNGVGANTVQGIIDGVVDRQKTLTNLMSSVGTGMISAVSTGARTTVPSAGMISGGNNSTAVIQKTHSNSAINITVNNPIKEPASRSLTNAASRLVYLGARGD